MRADAVFRISSMTRPVTAVAVLQLVERGVMDLDEPVDRLLPELAGRRVLRRLDGPVQDTVPAQRPVTVRDLLTFRGGFGMILAPPEEYPVLAAEQALELSAAGGPVPVTPHAPDEWLRRLGTLPLMDQPGRRWRYATSSLILGVLVARAAGQPAESYYAENIFSRMLLTGGSLGGRRILAPGLVADMTADQLTPEQRAGADAILDGRGWGYGLSVIDPPPGARGAKGYGWSGGFGTFWFNDPAGGLGAGLCTQG